MTSSWLATDGPHRWTSPLLIHKDSKKSPFDVRILLAQQSTKMPIELLNNCNSCQLKEIISQRDEMPQNCHPNSVPPRAIKSDRGSPFFAMTNCVQKVMLNTESPHRLSTAYHPQKDGQVEESLQPAGLDHHCKHPSLSLPSTVELSQANGPNFKVNGHRVKHYFGGDLPQLELLRIVKALVFLSDLSIRSL
ncbi:reverse transcriptase domain-containing protein [Tanacetum coccineum]